jgi:hypothetical protein
MRRIEPENQMCGVGRSGPQYNDGPVVTKPGAFPESLGETTGKTVAAIAKQIESHLDS